MLSLVTPFPHTEFAAGVLVLTSVLQNALRNGLTLIVLVELAGGF